MKVLVLNCDDSRVWNREDGEFTFSKMFETCLCLSESIEWSTYDAFTFGECVDQGKVEEEANRMCSEYDIFIITGSRFNVDDEAPWFSLLYAIIVNVSMDGNKKLFGCCFGHQCIAHALGGKVSANPGSRFVLKAETLHFNQDNLQSIFDTANDIPTSSNSSVTTSTTCLCIESHGYCVSALPQQALLLASSETCQNEVFVAGDKLNIIGCQGHPEFDLSYCIYENIYPAVVKKNKKLSDQEVAIADSSFQMYEASREKCSFLVEVLRRFLLTDCKCAL